MKVLDRFGRRATRTALAVLALLAIIPVTALTGAARAGATTTCTTSWTAPGTSGAFGLAKNWTNGAPTATSDACLPLGATAYTVTVHGSASAHSVTVGLGATLDLESTTAAAATLAVGAGGVANSGTITLVNTDPSPRASTLSVTAPATIENDGAVQLPATAGSVTQQIDAILHDTANGSLDVANNTLVSKLANDGFVTVEAGAQLSTPALADYNAATHTLTGGEFDLTGTLVVPSLDVTALAAGVSLDGSGGFVDSTANADGLRDLADVTAAGSLSVGAGVNLSTGVLTNHGRVMIGTNGSLASAGNYTQAGVYTSLSPGSHLFTSPEGIVSVTAGDIVGSGSIESSVVNTSGTIFPAPQLGIAGTYTQKKGGTLSIRVGGIDGNGSLSVAATAWIGGTFDVTAADGFTPQLESSFDVVTSVNLLGAFSKVVSNGLASPFEFAAGYSPGIASAVVLADYNDTNPAIQYQGWQGITSAGGSGGSFRGACNSGETATFTFSGKTIVWDTAHGTEMGNAQVAIDGVNQGTFDLYAASNAPFAQKFSKLTAGTHTIVITVLGTRGPFATDTCVVIDNFKVGKATTEDTSRAINWSGWTGVKAGSDGYRVASTTDAIAKIGADMTVGVEWVTRIGPGQGMAAIAVDGTVVQEVNLYSATAHPLVREFVPTPEGFHVVSITVLGTKDPASTGTAVSIGAFIAH